MTTKIDKLTVYILPGCQESRLTVDALFREGLEPGVVDFSDRPDLVVRFRGENIFFPPIVEVELCRRAFGFDEKTCSLVARYVHTRKTWVGFQPDNIAEISRISRMGEGWSTPEEQFIDKLRCSGLLSFKLLTEHGLLKQCPKCFLFFPPLSGKTVCHPTGRYLGCKNCKTNAPYGTTEARWEARLRTGRWWDKMPPTQTSDLKQEWENFKTSAKTAVINSLKQTTEQIRQNTNNSQTETTNALADKDYDGANSN